MARSDTPAASVVAPTILMLVVHVVPPVVREDLAGLRAQSTQIVHIDQRRASKVRMHPSPGLVRRGMRSNSRVRAKRTDAFSIRHDQASRSVIDGEGARVPPRR